MPYFIALNMNGLKFLEDSENNQINLWSKHNSITLDRMIMEI